MGPADAEALKKKIEEAKVAEEQAKHEELKAKTCIFWKENKSIKYLFSS